MPAASLAPDPLYYTTVTIAVRILCRSGELPQACRALSSPAQHKVFCAVLSHIFPLQTCTGAANLYSGNTLPMLKVRSVDVSPWSCLLLSAVLTL